MNTVQQCAAVALARGAAAPRVEHRSRYFLAMSILLLAIVLIGFSRTLFLRSLFQVPAIPWYVYILGSVMAAWIALLVIQTSLVAAHRTDLHHRLGILGAVLAVAVVGLGAFLTIRMPANFPVNFDATGGPGVPLPAAIPIFWGNIGTMVLFPVLVATALCHRRRPDIHKRLMLLASMAMIGPAAGRITAFPTLSGAAPTAPIDAWVGALVVVTILGLPLTLVAHDLITSRRLHRATLWGVLAFFAAEVGMRMAAGTAAGPALWNALQ